MIDVPSAVLLNNSSVVEAIREDHPDGEVLFRNKFGRGLRFLAERYCGDNADACLNAAVSASINVIRSGAVTADDVQGLVRREFHRAVSRFSERRPGWCAATFEGSVNCDPGQFIDVRARLEIFTQLQRDVLIRFYLKGEDIPTICRELKVKPEQVQFLRSAVKIAIWPCLKFAAVPMRKACVSANTSLPSRSAWAV